MYAARLVEALRGRFPGADFFGCAGVRMRQAGVRAVVDAASLAVVGLVEVLAHIPRIYGEYRKILEAAQRERPDVAILTDSPDFHLRLAPSLGRMGIPVVYMVAPQAWAWRRGRVRTLRRNVKRLLCIFPFEEEFFRRYGVPAAYIGHPLAWMARPSMPREEFLARHGMTGDRPVITLLPGSRPGEIGRHLPVLFEAVERIRGEREADFLLAGPPGLPEAFFRERLGGSPIRLVTGETWDAIASADLALAASGTVTIEAAVLGVPMVTFYRVAPLSWWMGRRLVKAPYLSMVNLVAGKPVAPELMQNEMTGARLASEATRLLADGAARERMRSELKEVAGRLRGPGDPMERAADLIEQLLKKD